MKKKIKRILIVLLVIISILVIWSFSSSYPVSMIVRKVFETSPAVVPSNYDEILEQVNIERDISYDSSSTFDLIAPKGNTEKLPVIIWVHGGGFVGGDKSDIEEYAVQIAGQGYIVANMNYELAPESKYPTPLLQLNKLYSFLEDNAEEYSLDMTNIFFAGDSAGAHIVSQFAMIQTDENYSDLVGIEAVVNIDDIAGVLLFCGPYDIEGFISGTENNAIFRFIFNKLVWGYTDIRDINNNHLMDEMSIINHVSDKFPTTFITDGNTFSFTQQGIDLSDKLKELGVDTTAIFYDTDYKLIHEYQFIMDNEYSIKTFEKVIVFLRTNGQ